MARFQRLGPKSQFQLLVMAATALATEGGLKVLGDVAEWAAARLGVCLPKGAQGSARVLGVNGTEINPDAALGVR